MSCWTFTIWTQPLVWRASSMSPRCDQPNVVVILLFQVLCATIHEGKIIVGCQYGLLVFWDTALVLGMEKRVVGSLFLSSLLFSFCFLFLLNTQLSPWPLDWDAPRLHGAVWTQCGHLKHPCGCHGAHYWWLWWHRHTEVYHNSVLINHLHFCNSLSLHVPIKGICGRTEGSARCSEDLPTHANCWATWLPEVSVFIC